MRIVAGRFKGRRIKTVKSRLVRPTSEKVREALFDILRERVEGALVLDLFAGSGALGLEALSRGAKEAVLVENWHPAIQVINKNVKSLGVQSQVRVIKAGYLRALKILQKRGCSFDLILADPPYHFFNPLPKGRVNRAENLLSHLDDYGILKKNGILIHEHFARFSVDVGRSSWQKFRHTRYGQTCLSFFC